MEENNNIVESVEVAEDSMSGLKNVGVTIGTGVLVLAAAYVAVKYIVPKVRRHMSGKNAKTDEEVEAPEVEVLNKNGRPIK